MSGLDDEMMRRVRAHAAAWRVQYGQLEVPIEVVSVFRAKATQMYREAMTAADEQAAA